MSNVQGVPYQDALVRTNRILKNVYVWMAAGLAITGVVSYGIAQDFALANTLVKNTALFVGIIVAQLALVWFLSARLMTLSPTVATIGFAAYAALNGLTLSLVFLAYTGESVAQVFFITAGTFAAMSAYAVTTKRDLTGWGNYLTMALIGLVIASVVNLIIRSDAFSFVVSLAGVALFLGLTAYDTQVIKRWSEQLGDEIVEADYIRVSVMGALKLYLDFINLFLFLLRILGRRR